MDYLESRDALKRCERRDVTTLKHEPIVLQKRTIRNDIVQLVKSFSLTEDISRPTAGKKETVTRGKIKKQKHLLIEPLSRTYKTFRAEYPTIQLSVSAFRRLQPFWVVRPRIQDRDTCRCQRRDNIAFMHERLKELSCVSEATPRIQVGKICCNIGNKDCMYRDCKRCSKMEAATIIFCAEHKEAEDNL